MKQSWNVLRAGVALGACLGLLAACGDRGSFKSRTYSQAEIDAFIKTQGQKTSDTPAGTPSAPDTVSDTTPDPSKTPDQTTPSGTPNNGQDIDKLQALHDKREEQQLQASGQLQPKPATQQPGTGVQNLAYLEYENSDFLKAKDETDLNSVNPDAAKIVSAIDIPVSGTGPNNLVLGVDAVVNINGQVRFLFVQNFQLAYSQGKQPVNLMPISLQEHLNSANLLVSGDTSVLGKATCTDATCGEIQVRFEILTNGKTTPTPVVFALTPSTAADGKTKVYTISRSNVAAPKDIVSYQKFIETEGDPTNPKKADQTPVPTKPTPVAQPPPPGPAQTAVVKADPSAPAVVPAPNNNGQDLDKLQALHDKRESQQMLAMGLNPNQPAPVKPAQVTPAVVPAPTNNGQDLDKLQALHDLREQQQLQTQPVPAVQTAAPVDPQSLDKLQALHDKRESQQMVAMGLNPNQPAVAAKPAGTSLAAVTGALTSVKDSVVKFFTGSGTKPAAAAQTAPAPVCDLQCIHDKREAQQIQQQQPVPAKPVSPPAAAGMINSAQGL